MDRVILCCPIAMAVGIGLYFQLPDEPAAIEVGLFAVSVSAAAIFAIHRSKRDQLRITGILALCMLLGLVAAYTRSHMVAAPVLTTKEEGKYRFTGRIVEIEHFPDGDRLLLDQVMLSGLSPHRTPEHIRIRLRDRASGRLGQVIGGDAVLRPPPIPSVPGVYDFAQRAWFEGIGAVGFALRDPTVVEEERRSTGTDHLWLLIEEGRERLGQILYDTMADKTEAALAIALTTGDRSRIGEDIRQDLRAAGLAHLLAISGLHMALVVVFLFGGIRSILAAVEPIALRYPIKKWAAAISIIGAMGYLLLAGATIPTQRAFLMALVAMIAIIIDRRAISLRLVAFAAMIVLLLNPESLLGPSFQLSFAAVTALVSVYEMPWVQRLHKVLRQTLLRRIAGYFFWLSLTTLIASFSTAPLIWHHFGEMAPYGLLGNLAAIPLMAFVIMPLLVLAVLCAGLFPASILSILCWPLAKALSVLLIIADWVAGLDGAIVQVTPLHLWPMLVIVAGGLWLCLDNRPRRIAALAVIGVGLVAAPLFPTPDLLVSGNGRLVGVNAGDSGILLSSLRREKFAAELWRSQLGAAQAAVFPDTQMSWDDAVIRCDRYGCIIKTENGLMVSIVERELALLEDCLAAHIVIAPTGKPSRKMCQGPDVLIDGTDLAHNGGHAIYFKGRYPWSHGLTVISIRQESGQRPWSGLPDTE